MNRARLTAVPNTPPIPALPRDRLGALGPMLVIPTNRIRRCPTQPRTHFDAARLKNLTDSIEMVGQKVPILVRRLPDNATHDYELVDGERRWRACSKLGIETMKAWLTEATEPDDLFLDSVVSNFGREGHTLIETARALGRLRAKHSVAELAKIFCCSDVWVYQHLRFLDFPPQVRRLMEPDIPEERRLVFSTANLLASIPDTELQIELALAISEKGLNTKAAKYLIETRCLAKGTPIHRSNFTPRRDYAVFRAFLVRGVGEFELWSAWTLERLTPLFATRPKTAVAEMIARCERIAAMSRDLAKRLRKLTP